MKGIKTEPESFHSLSESEDIILQPAASINTNISPNSFNLVNAEDALTSSIQSLNINDQDLKHDDFLLKKDLLEIQPILPSNTNTDVSSSTQTREDFVVRIKGLPWRCSFLDIQNFFSKCCFTEQKVLFSINFEGKSIGEAFLILNSQYEYDYCLSCHRTMMNNRYIEVFPSSKAEFNRVTARNRHLKEIYVKPKSIQTIFSEYILRMRGLPFSASEHNVRSFFGDIHVDKLHFMFDQSMRPTGEAYLEFSDEETMLEALKLHKHFMQSRYVELFKVSSQEFLRALYISKSNFNSRASMTRLKLSKNLLRCCRMQGLPYSATEVDITAFFQEVGITPQKIHRKIHGGEAYIEFHSPSELQIAMQKHRHFIGSRYIELFRVPYYELARIVGIHLEDYRQPPIHHPPHPSFVRSTRYQQRRRTTTH